MAKIKYKTKGVERKGGGNVPKPGVYRCKVISCVDATPSGKDRRLEVTYEIQEGESKGYKLYDYINLVSEAAEWKLAQFVDALGLPENGTIDTEEIVDTALNVRTRVENSEQYGASAKPATLMPLDGDEDEEDLTAEDDDDTSADDGDDDAASDDDEVYSEEELEALEKDELKEVAEEYEVEWPKRLTAAGKKKVIAAILEAQGGDEDEDEEGEGDDELWTEEELNELDDDDLVEQAGEFELDADDYQKTTGKGKAKKTKLDRDGLIAAILEAQGDEDEDGEESEDEDDTPDYDEMELADLKALCKERSLNPKGTKKVLVARLKKDDEPF
jgi:hypothetical protein